MKQFSVSDVTAVVVHKAKFIYPLAQAYSELLAVLYSELYLQYDSCDITTYSAYNLTYSAYSVNVQRN